jgi:hypothetical protein
VVEHYASVTRVNDDGTTVVQIWQLDINVALDLVMALKATVGEPITEALSDLKTAHKGMKTMSQNSLVVMGEVPDGN